MMMRMMTVPVSQLVCHGEGQGQPRVLVDVAAPVGLAHPSHVGQPQGLTGPVHGSTDVLPGTGTDTQTHRHGAGRRQDPAQGQQPNRSEQGDIQHPSTGETFPTFPPPSLCQQPQLINEPD